MKNLMRVTGSVLIAAALVTGCGEKTSKPATEGPVSELTAADLARLTDFHAWKVRVPETQQTPKSIQLVVYKSSDGTVISKHPITGEGSISCASILLGFHVEGQTFKGHLFTEDTNGGGMGWNIDFTDTFADFRPSWAVKGVVWQGNRAPIAQVTSDKGTDSILAIELVK